MKNIWKIFTGDMKKIHKNTIAVLVIIGLVIVPSLYAWFNIAASWDPYGSTGNLKVAVASDDTGYEGALFPVKLNLGEQVIAQLRANDQLQWVFTDSDKAVEGVKDGSYYAAIVLPESFSRDLMSIFAEDVSRADILYYLNEKENAIAPKITDKGAGAVQRQIDETFAKTVTEVAAGVTEAISAFAGGEDGAGSEKILRNLSANLSSIESELTAASETVTAFSDMAASLEKALRQTAQLLDGAGETAAVGQALIEDADKDLQNISGAMEGAAEGVNQIFNQLQACYAQISAEIDEAFASLSEDTDTAGESLNGLAEEMQTLIERYTEVRNSLQKISDSLPESETQLRSALSRLIVKADESIARAESVKESLQEAAENIGRTAADTQQYRKELQALIKESADSLQQVQNDYEENVQKELSGLLNTLGDTGVSVSALLTQLDSAVSKTESLSKSGAQNLRSLQKTLQSSAVLLNDSARQVKSLNTRLQKAMTSGDTDTLKNLLSSQPEDIGSFVSAPVKLSTHKFYPVENYGSAMAPFYSVLAIWVGGIVLVAMLKVSVEEKRQAALSGLKEYQLYLGRFILFLLLGLAQSALICLGDLYYLEIQCVHPGYFLLAGLFTSVVFVNVIFTLTVSFGDIGKAICVILLVIQVAGSGGTFPIEMTPEFFRQVYQLLPFTHSMAALREAIAGFYEATYWTELGKLSLFLLLSLLLGLVLRKPIIRLNENFMKKLEETKVM